MLLPPQAVAIAKVHPEDVSALQQFGMLHPSPHEEQYALLRAPCGYARSWKERASAHRAAYQFWHRATLEDTPFRLDSGCQYVHGGP